jgi:hypothetical protein
MQTLRFQSVDDFRGHLRRFARKKGIVFVGKAQENTPVFRTKRRRKRMRQ